MQIKQHLLDKRVVKRALAEGLLDKALYQKALDELPDLSHRVQAADNSEPAPVAHEPAAPFPPNNPPNNPPSY